MNTTEYGQAYLYRVEDPAERDRALNQAYTDWQTAAERYGFPDDAEPQIWDAGRDENGWAYLTWTYIRRVNAAD